MLNVFILLCVLIWIPLLIRQFINRSYSVLLMWLLIAPVVTYSVHHIHTDPVLQSAVEKDFANTPKKLDQGTHLYADRTIRLEQLLEPNRLLFVALFGFLLVDAFIQKRYRVQLDGTEKWMGLFVIILLASALLQSRRAAFALRVITDAFTVPYLAYYCTRRLVRGQEALYKLMKTFGYLGLYLILIGVIERLAHPNLTYRLSGPFEFRDGYYFVIMAVFFIILPEVVSIKSKGHRYILPYPILKGMLGFAVAIIVLTWTRACWLGFLCGLWTFAWLGRHLMSRWRKHLSIGLGLALMPLGAILIYQLLSVEEVSHRVGNVEYIIARLLTYQRIWEEFIQHPIFGIGFHNLLDALQYKVEWNGIKSYVNTHQSYLAILAEMGALGLVAFLTILVSMFRVGYRVIAQATHPVEQWQGICVIAMLVAYLIPPLTDSTLYKPFLPHTYIYVWVGAVAGAYPQKYMSTSGYLPGSSTMRCTA